MHIRQLLLALTIYVTVIAPAPRLAGQTTLEPAPAPGTLRGADIERWTPPPHADSKPWTGPRLPDGQPDVQGGLWGAPSSSFGPLENPVLANIDFGDNPGGPRKLPSRIVDPVDGLVPYQPWAAARKSQEERDRDNPTRPEHLDTQHRCIIAPPRLYYSFFDYKIIQTPGFISFVFTQNHPYRVIPVRPENYVDPGPNLELWNGFPRGRWDGNTLVVETTRINGKSRLSTIGDFFTNKAHFTERFTFLDAATMTYEVTIEDQTVFTRPWTMRVTQKRRKDDEIWEDACHEGMETERGLFEKVLSLGK